MWASLRISLTCDPIWRTLDDIILKGEAALTAKSLIIIYNIKKCGAAACTWLKACSEHAKVRETAWKRGSSRAEFDKLCERDPLLLCGFQNAILKGVFSTDLISAVKYFCVGETVWMSSQTLTHSLIKPPFARGVQSDLLSVMLGRNERMTTICMRFFD